MPELPEVETTRLGISPYVLNERVLQCRVHVPRLRYPVPEDLPDKLREQEVLRLERRGKYLIFSFANGHMIVHLGMSGSLRLLPVGAPLLKHDHVEWELAGGRLLRFRDPRRFGLVLWTESSPEEHPLLAVQGPEPLGESFSADYLYGVGRKRKVPAKSLIMNSHVVVGVGNIYANEALFMSGIHPLREANRISRARYEKLVEAIKEVLAKAITQGGTTLRDFVGSDGSPGYFKQSLSVYGRGGEACVRCKRILKEVRLQQRTTVFCPGCQR